MKSFKLYKIFLFAITFAFVLIILPTTTEAALAKKKGGKGAFAGGGFSAGLVVGFAAVEQKGLNELISAAKTTSAATTGNLNSGMEYGAHLTFRFSNNFVALQLRPMYFQQEQTGSGTGGSFNYGTHGFTVFPLVRLIPLSNEIIDFYIQGGLGYGELTGKITNGSRSTEFKGAAFGTQIGLGADFCFVPDHCFGVEGNYKYMPVSRNLVTSSSGALPDGVSQATSGRELEGADMNDIETRFSGVSGTLTYTYVF